MHLKGNYSKYFGSNLYDKNRKNTEFKYEKNSCINCSLTISPYSITFFEEL